MGRGRCGQWVVRVELWGGVFGEMALQAGWCGIGYARFEGRYGIEEEDYRQFQVARARHWIRGCADCAFDAADQSFDGAFAAEQEGSQFAPGVADDGESAAAAVGLFEADGIRSVRGCDAEVEFAPLSRGVEMGRARASRDARVLYLPAPAFGMERAGVP